MLEMINTGTVDLTAGEIIPFASVTFDTNGNASGNPATGVASITTLGYYRIKGTFVLDASAEGTVTVNMLTDGTAEPGATASFSATAANTIETISIDKVIQVESAASGNTAQVSFQVAAGSAASSMTNAVMQVEFLE